MRPRLVATLAVVVLAAGVAVAIVLGTTDRARDLTGDVVDGGSVAAATPSASPSEPSLTPSPSPSVAPQDLLTDPAVAATATLSELHRAVESIVDGTVTAAWVPRVRAQLDDWPVAVGRAVVGPGGRVEFDVTWAGLARPPGGDQLVLRALPAAAPLGDTGFEVVATLDGRDVAAEVDTAGARLLIDVPEVGALPHVRVTGSYTVPALDDVEDDGGPAGFGLLARSDGVTTLAHWLPLPVLPTDTGPMPSRGDVGAFPTASWSLVVEHPDELVTGGVEVDCPRARPGCTWTRGVGLRDVSAVVLDTAETAVDPPVAASAPTGMSAGDTRAVADRSAELTSSLAGRLGGLPWPEVDIVPVRFRPGAAGMEFPGMIWVDRDAWQAEGFGAYVLAHELGHQWFHALVGNGSLSSPVVDESLAQYAAYLAFADVFGEGAATSLAAESFGGRHRAAVAEGVPDDLPAQPLEAFSSDRAYGAAVYGRAGQAWVDAEDAVGRELVVAALTELVRTHGLAEVDERDVVDLVASVSTEAAEILRAGWGLGR